MCLHGSYFYTARVVMQTDKKWYCTFSWTPEFDDHRSQERYFIFISVFLIFLPLCVIIIFALILKELKKRSVTENGASAIRRQRQREDAAIVKKILIIVFLFLFCITPLTVSASLCYFVWDWHLVCGMDKLFSAVKLIFYSNVSLNPCVYILLSERFRQGLRDLANCLYSRQESRKNTEVVNE